MEGQITHKNTKLDISKSLLTKPLSQNKSNISKITPGITLDQKHPQKFYEISWSHVAF